MTSVDNTVCVYLVSSVSPFSFFLSLSLLLSPSLPPSLSGGSVLLRDVSWTRVSLVQVNRCITLKRPEKRILFVFNLFSLSFGNIVDFIIVIIYCTGFHLAVAFISISISVLSLEIIIHVVTTKIFF